MKFDLASMVKRPSKRPLILANVKPTQAQADDLAAVYLRVVAEWSRAQDTIVAAYARALARLVTDSADDAGSTIDTIASAISRLILLLTPDLRRWALRVEIVQRGKWVSNILSAASVDLSTVLSAGDVTETVDAVVNWNAALIKDVSQEARQRIANAVFSGLQQRKAAVDVAKEIRQAVDMSRARSIRVAADQTVKIGSRLNQARQEQAGLTKFKWRHSAKAHPRLWHEERDGKVYSWADPGIPADDMPGVPPFCGCTAQGVVDFGDE